MPNDEPVSPKTALDTAVAKDAAARAFASALEGEPHTTLSHDRVGYYTQKERREAADDIIAQRKKAATDAIIAAAQGAMEPPPAFLGGHAQVAYPMGVLKLVAQYDIDKTHATTRPRSEFMDHILGWEFKVHEHGFVRVIDYLGDDAAIVQAARVSYGKGTKSTSEDRSLIRYLIENSHTSPLEQVEIKFHIRLPIFVARQWLRHRAASANEYSGRYSEMFCDFYIPIIEDIAGAPKDNKQGRGGDMTLEQKQKAQDLLRKISDASCAEYHKLLDDDIGLARELARLGLTLNTYTEMYWKMDLHNLANFIRLRFHSHAQKEIRDFAEVIWDIMCGFLPLASQAIKDFVLDAQKFSGPAMTYLRSRIQYPHKKIAMVPGMSRREKRAIDTLFPKKESFIYKAMAFILDRAC
mgnify:CR=1 FL=1